MPPTKLNLLQQEKPTILAIGILCSRLLGFFRDVLFAYWLGATLRLDAFLIAFKMPNLARRLLTEGVLNQAILPKLTPYRQQRDLLRLALWQTLRRVFWQGLVLLVVVEVLSPWLIMMLAPGFTRDPQVWVLATHLLRLTLPVMWFIALTSICATALTLIGAYTTVAIAPALMNIVIVSMLIIWVPSIAKPLTWVALSVSVAGLMQLLIQIPALIRHELWWRSSDRQLDNQDKTKSKAGSHLGIRLLALVSAQLGIVIAMGIASFLPAGSISCIYFIDRLTAFPMALVGAVIASIAIPKWGQNSPMDASEVPFDQYWPNCAWILRLAIPASLGLYVLAAIILRSLFSGAAFNASEWHILIAGLRITAWAVTPWLLIKVLASLAFAEGNTRHAGYAALVVLLFTLVAGILASARWQVLGVLSCLSLSAYLNLLGVLWPRLQRQGRLWLRQLRQELLPIGAGCAIMVTYLYGLLPYLPMPNGPVILSIKFMMIAKLMGVIGLAVVIYGLSWQLTRYLQQTWLRVSQLT